MYTIEMKTDKQLISELGGCAELARKLGLENPKGMRRIHKWYLRNNIPASWKLKRQDLFMDASQRMK